MFRILLSALFAMTVGFSVIGCEDRRGLKEDSDVTETETQRDFERDLGRESPADRDLNQ